MKGISIHQGQVIVLSVDGTLVYVESVEPTYAAVVALPDQPTERADERVFTPGRVGSKKISPFSTADKEVAIIDLTQRNKDFIGAFEKLRTEHGPNYVDRTPEELVAHEAAMNPPDKGAARAAAKAIRASEKAAKKSTGGPRYLQRCIKCNEQPGHPNHTNNPHDHEFEAPPEPVILCLACDKDKDHITHIGGDALFTHRFMGGTKPARVPKPAREPKAPGEPKAPRVKAERTPRAGKPSLPGATTHYRWVADEMRLSILRSANGKYNEGNSGNALIEQIKAVAEVGLTPLEAVGQPKCPSTLERAQLAFQQLLGAGLLEVVA